MLRRSMRGGNFSTGAGWGLCGLPNVTSKQGGMAGMGQDWWSLGSQLLSGATQLGTQYLSNQQPAPQIIYQQPPAPAPVVVQPQPSSSNTLLYVALGAVAVGGLVWYLTSKK